MEAHELRPLLLIALSLLLASCGIRTAKPNAPMTLDQLKAIVYFSNPSQDPTCADQYLNEGPIILQASQVNITTRALPTVFSEGWVGIFERTGTDYQYRAWKWVNPAGGELRFDLTSLMQASMQTSLDVDIRFFCGGSYIRSPYVYQATVKL